MVVSSSASRHIAGRAPAGACAAQPASASVATRKMVSGTNFGRRAANFRRRRTEIGV
jgi:hypothetical protein